MYRVIYYNDLNIVTDKSFETQAAAEAFAGTLDWYKIITLTESRVIADVVTP